MQQDDTMDAKEAAKELAAVGLSSSTLRRWARENMVRRFKNNVYSRSDILNAVNTIRNGGKVRKISIERTINKEHFQLSHVRIATEQDAYGMAHLISGIFGGTPNPERWASWMRRNPDIAYIGIVGEEVVSCGFAVPFTEKKILSILVQEITPATNPDEILEYTPGAHVCLYLRTICVAMQNRKGRDYSHAQRKIWSGALLRGMSKGIIALGARGVIIDKIYGRSDTPDGERAMRLLGCTEIKTTTSHHNFIIDVPTSGLKMVRRYEQRFLEWQKEHCGE